MPPSKIESSSTWDLSPIIEPEPSTDGSGEVLFTSAGGEGLARVGETAADLKPSSKIEVRCDFEASST
jgi:hypothetical protein